MSRIVALVPMRHSSERVPGKNYRDFHGRPLYHRVIEALLASRRIDEVLIDTDSPFIAEDARRWEAVRVVPRPRHLLGGEVSMNAILQHDIAQVEADWFLQTHSTNPLLRSSTVASAIDRMLGAGDDHDSLFSVTPLQTRLYWPDGRAINHDPGVLLRTQDLPPVYEENSCLYLFTRETLAQRGSRIGETPILFEMAPDEATDIDVELDFQMAELLYGLRKQAHD